MKGILTMSVRKKKYPSSNIGVLVVEKIGEGVLTHPLIIKE